MYMEIDYYIFIDIYGHTPSMFFFPLIQKNNE